MFAQQFGKTGHRVGVVGLIEVDDEGADAVLDANQSVLLQLVERLTGGQERRLPYSGQVALWRQPFAGGVLTIQNAVPQRRGDFLVASHDRNATVTGSSCASGTESKPPLQVKSASVRSGR